MVGSILMSKRLALLVVFGVLLSAGIKVAPPASAMPLSQVVSTIRDAGGRYVAAGASLQGSDCSGLVSVAQSLATGQPIRRLGSTTSMLAGQWPSAIPGATPGDSFIIAANRSHMVAQVNGTGIEATTSGQPYKIGPSAASVWDPRFVVRFHVDPNMLLA